MSPASDEFIKLTHTDERTAKYYLQIGGGSVEAAVSRFFDGGMQPAPSCVAPGPAESTQSESADFLASVERMALSERQSQPHADPNRKHTNATILENSVDGAHETAMNAKQRRKAKRASKQAKSTCSHQPFSQQHQQQLQFSLTSACSQPTFSQTPGRANHEEDHEGDIFTLLVHFHHILNPEKRQVVQDWAWELGLGGVSRTGTPGEFGMYTAS